MVSELNLCLFVLECVCAYVCVCVRFLTLVVVNGAFSGAFAALISCACARACVCASVRVSCVCVFGVTTAHSTRCSALSKRSLLVRFCVTYRSTRCVLCVLLCACARACVCACSSARGPLVATPPSSRAAAWMSYSETAHVCLSVCLPAWTAQYNYPSCACTHVRHCACTHIRIYSDDICIRIHALARI